MTKVCGALHAYGLNRLTPQAADQYVMHVFSRVSGPRDVLNILEGAHFPSFSFHRAFRITHRRSRVDELHETTG